MMPRMVRAVVKLAGGEEFEAEATSLAVDSMFLCTDRALSFRQELRIQLLGLEIKAEVVHVSAIPPTGVGVVFAASDEARSALRSAMAKPPATAPTSSNQLPANLGAPTADLEPSSTSDDILTGDIVAATSDIQHADRTRGAHPSEDTGLEAFAQRQGLSLVWTPSSKDGLGAITVEDPLDALCLALMLRAERSCWIASPPQTTARRGEPTVVTLAPSGSIEADARGFDHSTVRLRWRSHTVEIGARPEKGGLRSLAVRDTEALLRLIEALRVEVEKELWTSPVAGHNDVPELASDGRTVRFTDRAQYDAQWRANIAQGALVVRAAPIAETHRKLRLEIPGIAEPVEISARVLFHGGGTVGFEIETFADVRPTLEWAAENTTPWKDATPVPSSVPKRAFQFTTVIRGQPNLRAIMDFTRTPANDLQDGQGWFLRTLEYLFRANGEAVIHFSQRAQTLTLWVTEGRLVFSTRTPPSDEDFLGRILQRDFKVRHTVIDEAMRAAKEAGQALGDTLVTSGMITQQILNRALRQQMVDRVLDLRTWHDGNIEVSAWRNPRVRGDLIAVAGQGLVTAVLREYIRHVRVSELESELQPFLMRAVRVDGSRLDARLGLKPKELRLFQRAAASETMLQQLGTVGGVGAIDALRLTVLGAALGLIDFGEHASRAASTRGQASDITKRLEDELASMRHASHFEVLGVHWTASEAEMEQGYRDKVTRLKAFAQSDNTRAADLAKQILTRVGDARLTLMDRRMRRLYREQRWTDGERRAAADHLVEHAQLLLLRGDARGAADLVSTAEELCMTERAKQVRELLGSR
ncbi:MAG: hypothetical protein IPK13_18005 [Deltaproteobacteria bacterium]|nr:hypothetical protein [Deltaproteobacteria bacterium]